MAACPDINLATFSDLPQGTMNYTTGSWWMRHLPLGKKTVLFDETEKTRVLILDLRKKAPPPQALLIKGTEVELVDSFRFLGLHITSNLSWSVNTSVTVKKEQQWLYFIRSLKTVGLSHQPLTQTSHSNFPLATPRPKKFKIQAVWFCLNVLQLSFFCNPSLNHCCVVDTLQSVLTQTEVVELVFFCLFF